MTETDKDDLVVRLRQFQADEPGFPPLFSRAADEIERLRLQLAKARSAFDAAVATTTGNDFNTALVELCHILADDVGNSEEAND